MPDEPEPRFGELLDWLEGRLDPAAAATMAERVAAGDQTTTRAVEWIRAFLTSAQRARLETPPPLIRQRLRQSFERRWTGPAEVVRLRAELTFDSRSQRELLDVRAGAPESGGSHQLAFRAGDEDVEIDVLLDVTSIGDGQLRIDGQVFAVGSSPPIWEATIVHRHGRARDVEGDDLGGFSLIDIPVGPIDLTLDNGHHEVAITVELALPD